MQTRIITVTNNKGGVGKTTTVVNLAAGLAQHGRRVLVIDADPQANATFALLGPGEPETTLAEVLMGPLTALEQAVLSAGVEGIALVPGSIALSAADITLAGIPGREKLLARKLRALGGYDYVLIDTPPSLGILTVNSLTAAGEIFIPVGGGTFGLLGIQLLENTIAQLKENLELDRLTISGVIATLHDHTRIASDTVEALRAHFGDRLFRSVIPKNVDIEEAHSRSLSIFAYAPASKAGQAYAALVEEVIGRER